VSVDLELTNIKDNVSNVFIQLFGMGIFVKEIMMDALQSPILKSIPPTENANVLKDSEQFKVHVYHSLDLLMDVTHTHTKTLLGKMLTNGMSGTDKLLCKENNS
jgi:hypothetical protein